MAGTITEWIVQMRAGNENAAEQLWAYFSPSLLRSYAPRCRQLRICDEDDIIVSAFYQLVKAVAEQETLLITNRKEFWRLMRIISKRQFSDWVKYDLAKKRGGSSGPVSLSGLEGNSLEMAFSEETKQAEEANDLMNRLQQVTEEMSRPEFSKIIELKVLGFSNCEVARELGLSVRTIQYLIKDIKQAWLTEFQI
jgi:DNA-directed RNA polymerase specialized sigma24 family protein